MGQRDGRWFSASGIARAETALAAIDSAAATAAEAGPAGEANQGSAADANKASPAGEANQGRAADDDASDDNADEGAVIATPGDRKSVVSGKRVYVRVDLGGRRRMKKKKKKILIELDCEQDNQV